VVERYIQKKNIGKAQRMKYKEKVNTREIEMEKSM
jgi:hypothetical protein